MPHLASYVLSRIGRRLSRDWQGKYGHPIYLLETFVERDRFTGASYRAANWMRVGQAKGRTRQDRPDGTWHQVPRKDLVLVAERLGLDLTRCTLHREAPRQGLKAQERRAQTVAQLDTWEDIQKLADHPQEPATAPFTLVIEIDAGNIRERDDWGKTKALRQEGKDPKRGHWVYLATVFRLDHRGQTAGQRAVITQRGYVATRRGIEALMSQLLVSAGPRRSDHRRHCRPDRAQTPSAPSSTRQTSDPNRILRAQRTPRFSRTLGG